MSVVVYARLAELLEARQLSVAELERQIKLQYGISVNAKTLYRLAQSAPIQRADLEIAGAAAAVLGVGLDDLFNVKAVSAAEGDWAETHILGLAESRRMAALVEQQTQRLLTEREWTELEELVGKYGQGLHEQRLRARAQRRGITLEQEQRDTEAHLAHALEQWHPKEVEAQQEVLVDQAFSQAHDR